MSGPASGKPLGGGYEVARPLGKCSLCQKDIAPGEKFIASVREVPIGIERQDVCLTCRNQLDRSCLLASWQAVMPTPNEKKKMFVDDEVLKELFIRLADTTETTRIHFRFVLGLILMRKRLISYESTQPLPASAKPSHSGDANADATPAVAGDLWIVRVRGHEDSMEMINPQLSEEQVMLVSQQLGDILNEEL